MTTTNKLKAIKVDFHFDYIKGVALLRLNQSCPKYEIQNYDCYPFDYEVGDILKQAKDILEKNGLNVVGHIDSLNSYLIIVDNRVNEHITLK